MRFDGAMVFGVAVAAAMLTWGCARGPQAGVNATTVQSPTAMGNGNNGGSSEKDVQLDETSANTLASTSSAFFTRACDATTTRGDEQSRAFYGKACAVGDAEGCTKLGGLYMCGTSVEKNNEIAMSMFEKACALHDANGCQLYGAALVSGSLGKRDTTRGLRVYQDSCDHGSDRACGTLGSIYMMLQKPELTERALKLLDKSCTLGNADSCGNLAVIEINGMSGHAKNPERGATIAKRSCEKSPGGFGCSIYGMLLMTGTGVAKDERGAVKLFTIACNANEASGCTYLAACNYQGIGGVNQDVQKASELFRKGCDGGNGQACRMLAELSLSPAPSSTSPNAANPTMF